MKALNFIAGVALGAAAAIVAVKKFKVCSCGDAADGETNPAVKEAEEAVENLRSSVDSLRKELNSRIESEQTYASQCEELKGEVAKKEAEINNLKNVCDKQAGQIRKLEP
ncbi:MAG: hypothetical protein MJZ25_02385 [Fibrobacter sp.]|nr:hypothetical protein [Fibrobacter sp.]